LSISLAIYCEDDGGVCDAKRILASYSSYFAHVIVLINMESPPSFGPSELDNNTSILDLKGKISQGAALNKMLPHIATSKVLLIDARASLHNGVVAFVHRINSEINIQSPYLVGFQLSITAGSSEKSWKHDLSLVDTLPWCGLFFDPVFLLNLGGFEDQLSHKAMMIDLCIRAQILSAIIFQSDLCLSNLGQEPSKNEMAYIQQQYPFLYPNVFQRFLSMLKRKDKKTALNPLLN
jgi:hypothetical protein